MTKSPLGKCYIPVDTQEKYDSLMQTLKEHEYDYEFRFGMELSSSYRDGVIVTIGHDEDENEIGRVSELDKCCPKKKLSYEEAMKKLKPILHLNKEECVKIKDHFVKPTWTTKKEITRSDGIRIEKESISINVAGSGIITEVCDEFGAEELMMMSVSEAKELYDKLRSALAKHKKEFNS